MNRRHLHRSALMAAFLLLAFGRFARSEITHVGVPLRIASADAANANDIAFDDKHKVYLVVWSTASYSAPQGHTYGKFITADGQPISTFLISRGETSYATMPRVAYSSGSSDDVFLVVYGSDVNHPDATNLFGQMLRYNPTTHDPDFITPPGSLTTNFPVSRNSGDYTYAQYAGGIAYNPISHNFLVTWYNVGGHGDDAYCRLFNVDGTPVNNDKNLSVNALGDPAPYSQGAPNVAFDPVNQRYLVVYSGDTADGLSIGIFTALIDGVTGDSIGNPMTTVSTGGELEAFVLYLPEPQTFLTGWTEMAATRDVMGRKVDTNGVPYGAIYPLVQTFAGGTYPLNEGMASGAYNPNTRSALIACMHDSGTIWGAELNDLGLPLQTLQLSTTVSTGGGSYTPRVTAQTNEFGFSYALDFVAMYFERVQGGPGGPTLTSSPSSPVGAGTPVTWTATSSKTTPQEYRFWRFDGTTWTVEQDYTASNTYTWASATQGNYTFQVWIRAAGATNPWDEWTSAAMVVTPPAVTNVTVTPSATSVLPGTPITWTASGVGGVPPVQYRFFMKNLTAGTPFTEVQPYGTSTTWTLSAPSAGTSYLVQVWARSDGSAQPQEAWANSVPVSAGVSAVTVTTGSTQYTAGGGTITWTAVSVGGVAPVQYQFWMKNLDAGGTYAAVQGYSPNPSWTMGTAGGIAPGRYIVEVWARSAGSTAPFESFADAPMVTVIPRPLTVTSVTPDFTAASDGTAITWTATATGGTPPLQYRFYRRDSASGAWTLAQEYSASNKYTWPSAEVGSYMVEAWVRSFGSSNPYDAFGDSPAVVVTVLPRVTTATVMPNAINAIPGSSVTWTASAIGGVQPVQYDFWLKNMDTGIWAEVQPYSSSPTWTMTNAAAGRYVVEVWARSDGATRTYDTYVDSAVVTIGTLPVAITAFGPSATNTFQGNSVTWTATATGGTPPLQYRFYRYESATGWTMVQDYGTANTYTWSGVAVGTYILEVWVRSAGSTRQFEAYQDAVPVVVIPRPPVSGVTVTPTVLTAPFGTSVTWAASAAGGVTPYQYRFYLLNLGTGVWTEVQSYSITPTFTSASLPAGNYMTQVWARSAGSTAAYEAWGNSDPVAITEPPAPVITSFTASATSVLVGTPVTLSATTSGGVGPVVYTFWARDDSTGVWTQLQRGVSNSCSLTPLHAGSYMLEVWVSSAGATVAHQAYADIVLFAQ